MITALLFMYFMFICIYELCALCRDGWPGGVAHFTPKLKANVTLMVHTHQWTHLIIHVPQRQFPWALCCQNVHVWQCVNLFLCKIFGHFDQKRVFHFCMRTYNCTSRAWIISTCYSSCARCLIVCLAIYLLFCAKCVVILIKKVFFTFVCTLTTIYHVHE